MLLQVPAKTQCQTWKNPENGEFQLDGQYLDAQLKQLITRTLLTNKQVNEQDLLKLGIKVNMPHDQEQRSLLQDCHQAYLVFNLITQKLESYSQDAISLNNKYLISTGERNWSAQC